MKNAFTLAETLITLGIIGVVAAITIPNLITEYQKRTTVTKLQRAISVINQAYRLSYDENGDLTKEEANTMGAVAYFKQYWAPYIKVLTYCKTYAMCGYDKAAPFTSYNGTTYSQLNVVVTSGSSRTTFYTADGFLYVVYNVDGNGRVLSIVFVDINGGNKPNRFGHDVFVLDRVSGGYGVQPYGYDLSDETVKKNCLKGGSNYTETSTCAERIRRAGWRIEKDYPW